VLKDILEVLDVFNRKGNEKMFNAMRIDKNTALRGY